jgi:tetratricopeptide (TPR) repeat protein
MIHVEQAIADARQALEAGRLDEAEGALRGVLEFDDYEPRALRLMGQVVSRQGEPRRAAEYYKQALKARDPEQSERPQGPVPTPTLARLYAEQGHTEAAAQVYRELLDGAEDDPRAQQWRQHLAQLEGGAPAPQAAAPSEPQTETDEAVPAAVAEQRLRAFLELLDGNAEASRLRRFLERLEGRPAQ